MHRKKTIEVRHATKHWEVCAELMGAKVKTQTVKGGGDYTEATKNNIRLMCGIVCVCLRM